MTGADGRFTLRGIEPGLFSISAGREGYHRRLVSSLQAVDGLEVSPVEIQLEALAHPDDEPQDQLAGIGTALRADGDALVVVSVVEGGGGAEAGLQEGDRILTIDGRAVAELDFNSVIQLIRGPEGSTVLLTLQRDGDTETVDVPRRAIAL